MPVTTLDATIDTLILKAAKALEHTLDTSERETARVAAALGILRLAERAARRAEARERPSKRPSCPRERPRSAANPATTAPVASLASPSAADPAEPAAAEPTPSPAGPVPDPVPSAPDAEILTPDEIADLTRHFSILDPARLHDPDLTAYWRGKLKMARRWSCPPAQPPDGP